MALMEYDKHLILKKYEEGQSQSALAREYGVSRSTIQRAIKWARKNPSDKFEMEEELSTEVAPEVEDSQPDDRLDPGLFNAVMTKGSISISHPQGETRSVSSDSSVYEHVKKALLDGDLSTAYTLARPADAIKEWSDGILEVKDNKVYLHGEDISDRNLSLAKRMLEILKQIDSDTEAKNEFAKLVKFVKRCYLNPSIKVMSRIYDFCKATDIEIDEDGNLLCWKKVNDDYTDVYSGKINNAPGQVVSMPRTHVDDDDNRTCSRGLHVCSQSYLDHYRGARVVKVKVHPEDIISIPVDYNDAKMRTCRYEVIEDCTEMFYG